MSLSPQVKIEETRSSGQLFKSTVTIIKKIKRLPEGSILNLLGSGSFLVTWVAILSGRDLPAFWYALLFLQLLGIYFNPLIESHGRGGSDS